MNRETRIRNSIAGWSARLCRMAEGNASPSEMAAIAVEIADDLSELAEASETQGAAVSRPSSPTPAVPAVASKPATHSGASVPTAQAETLAANPTAGEHSAAATAAEPPAAEPVSEAPHVPIFVASVVSASPRPRRKPRSNALPLGSVVKPWFPADGATA